ncbi:protein SCAR2-like [Hordeum vulgare subsp. vulgare]|nr:protein SCAR2-like [Hordeum vulgare subsp. vulgare]
MAGFVGLLRQLGDLAQLAAEVFDGLREQATAVSAQARGLTLRARLLESQLPVVEERLRRRENEPPCFLQQDAAVARSNSVFSSGIRSECLCHLTGHGVGRRHTSAGPANNGMILSGGGTRPRSIAERIRRCRGPPRLSMLDKYDAGGEGACLRRYTDPSFFRAQFAKHELLLQETKPELQSSGKCSK